MEKHSISRNSYPPKHLCCENSDAARATGNFQYSRKLELLNFLWKSADVKLRKFLCHWWCRTSLGRTTRIILREPRSQLVFEWISSLSSLFAYVCLHFTWLFGFSWFFNAGKKSNFVKPHSHRGKTTAKGQWLGHRCDPSTSKWRRSAAVHRRTAGGARPRLFAGRSSLKCRKKMMRFLAHYMFGLKFWRWNRYWYAVHIGQPCGVVYMIRWERWKKIIMIFNLSTFWLRLCASLQTTRRQVTLETPFPRWCSQHYVAVTPERFVIVSTHVFEQQSCVLHDVWFTIKIHPHHPQSTDMFFFICQYLHPVKFTFLFAWHVAKTKLW